MAGRPGEPEEMVLKLRQFVVTQGQGRGIAEAVGHIGVSQRTYFRRHKH